MSPAEQADQQPIPLKETVLSQAPSSHQPMDPQRPHAQSEGEPEVQMRGGEACPGRFCFIIPCPIPVNCCIIPCPC